MASDRGMRRQRRSVIRRAWLQCYLLALPAFVFTGIFLYQRQLTVTNALLLACCVLLYIALTITALIDGFVRPLQTLSNVLASLREGDYSFRARGAGAGDALGELSAEVNALADLLQRQRVHSLETTALLARMLEVMHTPLFAFNRENRLQLVNDAGLELLGVTRARSFGMSAQELGLELLLEAEDETTHSFGVTTARWLLRKAAFRQDGVPHTLLLLADVSAPLQEEEQIAWKRLIRVLGHELSNSLAPIKSIAGSLRTRTESLGVDESLVSDFRRGLGVIEGRADALHRFVQSYRRLAQLPRPRLQSVDAAALLERVVLLEQRLPINIDPGPPAKFQADPDQLEQMLINLIVNAVDAALAKGSEPVHATWNLTGTNLNFVIEDRGLGIANMENLFVPFYTTKEKGSGVGLALAQQIARAHGGEIQLVNRKDGNGARATVRIPIGQTLESNE
jgi:two-component system, NtrC family, nitrogen regulation sensor histidine kinase NtrY